MKILHLKAPVLRKGTGAESGQFVPGLQMADARSIAGYQRVYLDSVGGDLCVVMMVVMKGMMMGACFLGLSGE